MNGIQCSSATFSESKSSSDNADPPQSLLVEMEKRGKSCPASTAEKQFLISKTHQFGHFGREAMFKHLWNNGFWWPSRRSGIEDQLKNCDSCTRYVVVKAGFHPAGSITANGPGDHFQIDTSVHLPTSSDGYVFWSVSMCSLALLS
jgi:hypothetical protein